MRRKTVFFQYDDFFAFSRNLPNAQSEYFTAFFLVKSGLSTGSVFPAGISKGSWLLEVNTSE